MKNAEKSITSESKLYLARHGTAVAIAGEQEVQIMNIFYIIGVVVVIVAILGFLGLR